MEASSIARNRERVNFFERTKSDRTDQRLATSILLGLLIFSSLHSSISPSLNTTTSRVIVQNKPQQLSHTHLHHPAQNETPNSNADFVNDRHPILSASHNGLAKARPQA